MAAPRGGGPKNELAEGVLKGLAKALGISFGNAGKKKAASEAAKKAAATRSAKAAAKKRIQSSTSQKFAANKAELEKKYGKFYDKIDIESKRGTGVVSRPGGKTDYVSKDRSAAARSRSGAMQSKAKKANDARRAEQDNLKRMANDRSLSTEKRVAARRKLRDHQKKYGNFGPEQGKR
jgi:hypothetical protein